MCRIKQMTSSQYMSVMFEYFPPLQRLQMQALNRRFYNGIMRFTLYFVRFGLCTRLTQLARPKVEHRLLRKFQFPLSRLEFNAQTNYFTGTASCLRHFNFMFKSSGTSKQYSSWPQKKTQTIDETAYSLIIVAITIFTEATEFGQSFCGIIFHYKTEESFVMGKNND